MSGFAHLLAVPNVWTGHVEDLSKASFTKTWTICIDHLASSASFSVYPNIMNLEVGKDLFLWSLSPKNHQPRMCIKSCFSPRDVVYISRPLQICPGLQWKGGWLPTLMKLHQLCAPPSYKAKIWRSKSSPLPFPSHLSDDSKTPMSSGACTSHHRFCHFSDVGRR